MLRTVIESPLFSSLRTDYLSEGEYHDFVTFLVYEPEAGALISGSGGCRKIRWKMQDSGKRSGVRVIYVVKRDFLILLVIYSKAANDTIAPGVLRKLRKELAYVDKGTE